jgi:rieske iron-sulfur protein
MKNVLGPRPCRRAVLKSGIGVALGLGLTPKPILAQDDPGSLRPQNGDRLVKDGDSAQTPLTPGDIPLAGVPVMAWAMDPIGKIVRSGSRRNLVLLMRFDSETLRAATRSLSAGGVVAYSALCSHAGCDLTDFLSDRGLVSCDCHSALFDPKDGAKVVDGPAPWALPALPLTIVDGALSVAGPFTAAVRFEE